MLYNHDAFKSCRTKYSVINCTFTNYGLLQIYMQAYFLFVLFPKGQKHEHEHEEWIERVKSEGAIPLVEPNDCSNGWASPRGKSFMIRGKEYLTTKEKIHGGEYLLEPLGFDWIKGSSKISEILNNPKSRDPFVWAFNFQLPTQDNHSIVAYFLAKEPSNQDPLFRDFLKGDDGFKNSRLKLIANVVEGPWIVKKSIGEQAICVIGRALSCRYSMGEKLVEVDIDVGSSMVATAIVHLAFSYLATTTVDLAFVIEGQTESELPERILGAVRFSGLDAATALQIELPSQGSEGDLHSSLPKRLWKSFGKGFS